MNLDQLSLHGKQMHRQHYLRSRPNRLTISIHPQMDIRLPFQPKRPGQSMILNPVDMIFSYHDAYEEEHEPEAYETLLLDAMEGNATQFMRAYQVEAGWRVVMPIIEAWEARPPGLRWAATPSNWLSSSRPRFANQAESSRPDSLRIDTAQRPLSATASWNRLRRSEHTSTMGGSRDTDVNALAVMACSIPSTTVFTTVTPLANRESAPRNAWWSTSVLIPASVRV